MESGKLGSAKSVYKQVGYEGHKTFHEVNQDLLFRKRESSTFGPILHCV